MAHRTPDPARRHPSVLRRSCSSFAAALLLLAAAGVAEEVTVQNDSLVSFGTAAVVPGFITGERAGVWLTSPCTGNIVALQVFWRSLLGGAPDSLEAALLLYQAGTFPEPGSILLNLAGPLLTDDNNFDEFRYTDGAGTVPIQIPVSNGETFVFALEFENINLGTLGPSVVHDASGCKANRNTIYKHDISGSLWVDACTEGISGNWVLRAVVNCTSEVPFFADGFESGNLSGWSSAVP